jgi:aryl-alcohol dehydrogenase-like predicted oxidoreductase
LGVIAHSTLAQGLLGGRVFPPNGFPAEDVRNRSAYFRPEALQDNLRTAGRVAAVARRLGRTPAQVAIRWAVDAPGITSALVGCKSPVQVDENCSVDFALTADDWASLDPSTDATLSNPRHL